MDSCKFDVIYYFPREVVTTKKCYDLLIKMNQSMEILADKNIFLDFTKTKRFETNLIVFLVFSLDRMKKRNNYTVAKLRNEKYVYNEKIIYELFKIYSVDKHAFLSPHKIGIREERLTEDVLLKYLKQMNLLEYEKIKIILSELIANIKMYSIYKEGAISGYADKRKHELIVSVANYDITIKGESARNKLEFETDFEAVMWALKKNNSTRIADETGGLGLYIMRKYISELDGRVNILSGSCYMELHSNCFDCKNENNIEVAKYEEMKTAYGGNIVTLYFPYRLKKQKDEQDKREYTIEINNL